MRLRHAIVGVLALAGVAAPAVAQSQPRPTFAVVLVVDGLTSDLFLRHRANFTAGLARVAQGTVFTNAASAGDMAVPSTGVGIALGTPGGLGASRSWTWDGRQFVGTTPASQSKVVPIANRAVAQMVARPEPALVPPPACAGITASTRFARAANDLASFAASPAMDGAVLALGAGLAQEYGIGRDANGDVLTLGLSATGRATPGSENSCLQLLALDRDLGDFFAQLDRMGASYVIAMRGKSAGGTPVPLMFWRSGLAGSTVATAASTDDLLPTVTAILGTPALSSITAGRCLRTVAGAACPR